MNFVCINGELEFSKILCQFFIKYALFSKIHEYDTKGNLGIKKSPPTQLLVWSIFQIWEKTWTSNYFDSHLRPSVVSFICKVQTKNILKMINIDKIFCFIAKYFSTCFMCIFSLFIPLCNANSNEWTKISMKR